MTQPQQEQPGLGALEAYIAYRAIQHSEDQDNLAAWLALKLWPLWQIVRFNELDETVPQFVTAALPQVETAYYQSQRLAAVFTEDVRMASLATAPPLPMKLTDVAKPDSVPVSRWATTFIPDNVVDLADFQEPIVFDSFPMSDAATTLVINGNFRVKAAMPGPEDELMELGLNNSAGGAIRQAINGSRNVTGQVMKFDRRVLGYARVTDGNPCWFCGLLASRGAVFKKGSFNTGGRTDPWDGSLTKADKEFKAPKDADSRELPEGFTNVAKVHDHCRCTLRPVYANERTFGDADFDPHRDEEAQFYYDQWVDASRRSYGKSNRQVANDFRANYKPFQRKKASVTDIRAELEQRANALSRNGFAADSPQVKFARTRLSQLG